MEPVLGNFDELKQEIFSNLHPQRNTFVMKKGLTISSDFDSGNLWKCLESQKPDTKEEFKQDQQQEILREEEIKQSDEGVYSYDLWICPDSLPYQQEVSYRTWFFFYVTNFPKDAKSLSFSIRNMSNQATLLNYGLKPIYIEQTSEEQKQFNCSKDQGFFNQKWKAIPTRLWLTKVVEGLQVDFHFVLKQNFELRDRLYFAFTYPFTFSDIEKMINTVELKFQQNSKYYFHREVICQSIEKRPMELLTLTGSNCQLEEREVQFGQDQNGDQIVFPYRKDRPFKFDKPTIFLTARVHCGETPGQFMLQGIIDMLQDFDNIQTQLLLEKYVFKIIPCLNPDGVSRGFWRHDTEGLNLNRTYREPDPFKQPTIFGAKEAVLQQHREGKLQFYMDIHGHCNKRGCFIFGNTIKEQDKAIDQMLIPKLMSLNSVNFDFKECSFNDEKNNVKDGKGMGRDGSGRAGIYRETQLTHCFTLEANYCTGHRVNALKQRYNVNTKQKLVKEDSQIQDVTSQYYKNKKCPVYNVEVFKDVGRSYLISILDYDGINPITRLISSEKESIDQALVKIRQELKRELNRSSIKKFKKANKNFKPAFELVMNQQEDQQKQHHAHDDFCLESKIETKLSFAKKDQITDQSEGGVSEQANLFVGERMRFNSEMGEELAKDIGVTENIQSQTETN